MRKEIVGHTMIGISLLAAVALMFFSAAREVGYVKASEITGAVAFVIAWCGVIAYCEDKG